MSEGSRTPFYLKRGRADEQKHHMRRRLEASWHETTKPCDLTATVNDAAVQRKEKVHVLLPINKEWGDLLNLRSFNSLAWPLVQQARRLSLINLSEQTR